MATSFGESLKKAREGKRITLRKLGEYVGKSVSYLSDIENNRKRPPKLETVAKIEECLSVNDGSLVTFASRLRRKIPKRIANRIVMMPKLSEALLRTDEDLTDEEFDDLMDYFEKIKKRRT